MHPFRGIRFIVDTKIIKNNIKSLKTRYPGYDYFMAVVKGRAYGYGIDKKVIQAMLDGGANYLVLCYLDEALAVRKKFPDIPILCLSPVAIEDIPICIENKIDITLAAVAFAEKLFSIPCGGLKVHIKLDTGLGRFGLRTKEEIAGALASVSASGAEVTGIYTHLISEDNVSIMLDQIEVFRQLTEEVDLTKIPIVHIPSGEAMTVLPKINFINGVRAGSACYGLIHPKVGVDSALSVVSEVLFTRKIHKGETIGYCRNNTTDHDGYAAMIPVGYSDGFLRSYQNHKVLINGAEQKPVGGIFMCQCYITCTADTKQGDEVVLFRDFKQFAALAAEIGTVPEEIVLSLRPTEIVYK